MAILSEAELAEVAARDKARTPAEACFAARESGGWGIYCKSPYPLVDGRRSLSIGEYIWQERDARFLASCFEDVPNLLDTVKALREAAEAFDDLCVCYRIGRTPTEGHFDRLREARKTMQALKEADDANTE